MLSDVNFYFSHAATIFICLWFVESSLSLCVCVRICMCVCSDLHKGLHKYRSFTMVQELKADFNFEQVINGPPYGQWPV